MKIKIVIFDESRQNKGEPEIMTYKGMFALETMIIKLTEKYIGNDISRKFESLLKRVD